MASRIYCDYCDELMKTAEFIVNVTLAPNVWTRDYLGGVVLPQQKKDACGDCVRAMIVAARARKVAK